MCICGFTQDKQDVRVVVEEEYVVKLKMAFSLICLVFHFEKCVWCVVVTTLHDKMA